MFVNSLNFNQPWGGFIAQAPAFERQALEITGSLIVSPPGILPNPGQIFDADFVSESIKPLNIGNTLERCRYQKYESAEFGYVLETVQVTLPNITGKDRGNICLLLKAKPQERAINISVKLEDETENSGSFDIEIITRGKTPKLLLDNFFPIDSPHSNLHQKYSKRGIGLTCLNWVALLAQRLGMNIIEVKTASRSLGFLYACRQVGVDHIEDEREVWRNIADYDRESGLFNYKLMGEISLTKNRQHLGWIKLKKTGSGRYKVFTTDIPGLKGKIVLVTKKGFLKDDEGRVWGRLALSSFGFYLKGKPKPII